MVPHLCSELHTVIKTSCIRETHDILVHVRIDINIAAAHNGAGAASVKDSTAFGKTDQRSIESCYAYLMQLIQGGSLSSLTTDGVLVRQSHAFVASIRYHGHYDWLFIF